MEKKYRQFMIDIIRSKNMCSYIYLCNDLYDKP